MKISMKQQYNIELVVTAGITIIAGLIVHIFIVTVNITDWMRRRPVTTTDQVLTSLSITRMFFQFVCLLSYFCDIFWIGNPIIYDIIGEYILTASFYVGVWLSALLSVVFCLIISNFHNIFYLRLKIIILQRITHLTIASVLVSICFTTTYFLFTNIEIPKNSTYEKYSRKGRETYYLFFLLDIVPFFLFLMSSVLLIFSLCCHMNRMTCDRSVTRHLNAYYKTIKYLTFSSFNYAFFLIIFVTVWFYQSSFDIIGIYLIYNAFPTLDSICLIYATTKLRNRLSWILQHATNYIFNKRGSEPKSGDLLETVAERYK